MKIKHTSATKERPMHGGILTGLVMSMGTTMICAGILAWMIVSERISEGAVGYGTLVIILTAAAVGAWISSRSAKQNMMLVCLLSAIAYFVVLLSCTALFFGGQYQGVGVTCLCIFCACACVGLLGAKRKRRGYFYKKRKYR